MAEIAYVGTSGVGLLTATNINAALPGTTNRCYATAVRTGARRNPRAFRQRALHLPRPAIEAGKAVFGRPVFPRVVHVVEGDRRPEQRDGNRDRQRPVSAGSAATRASIAGYPVSTWLSDSWAVSSGNFRSAAGRPSGPLCRSGERAGRRMAVERHLRGRKAALLSAF